MRWAFQVAAAAEVVTGLVFAADPALLAWLLLGVGLDPGGVALGRLGGVGLLCFGLACWPGRGAPAPAARRAMLLFQPAMALSLTLLALLGHFGGVLLWPAVLYHAGVGLLLARRARDFAETG